MNPANYIKEIFLVAALGILLVMFMVTGKGGGELSPKSLVTEDAVIGDTLVTDEVTPILSPKIAPKTSLSPTPAPTVDNVTKTASPAPSPSNTIQKPSPTPTVTSKATPSPSPSRTPSPSPTPAPTPEPTPVQTAPVTVVLNEVGWMGTSASQYAEWIELFNPGDAAIDLTGWQIQEVAGGAITANLTGSIGAGGFYLLERKTPSSPDAIIDISSDFLGSFGGSGLKDSCEELVLKDASGATIDQVSCDSSSWPAGTNSPDFSMERVAPGQGWATNNGQIRNGLDADGNPINGTPGAKNSVSF